MRKLFSVLGNTSTDGVSSDMQARFTRFESKDLADTRAITSDKKFTRFAPQHAERSHAPARRLPQPISPASSADHAIPPALQQSVNAMDHLTCEADIHLSIFRKALPQRFAKIYDNDGDSEIAAFFS